MALSDNVVNYRKLDESSGNAADSVWGKTLTANANITYGSSYWKINNWAHFPNNWRLDNLTAANAYLYQTSGTDASIAVWLKSTDTNQQWAVSEWPWNYVVVGIKSTWKAQAFTDSSWVWVESGSAINNWNWHLVWFSYTWWKIYLYVDGNIQNSGGTTMANNWSTGGRKICVWDSQNTAYTRNWDIDEVWLWTRALSAQERVDLYNWWTWLQYPFAASSAIKSINWLAYSSVKSINWLAKGSVKNFLWVA